MAGRNGFGVRCANGARFCKLSSQRSKLMLLAALGAMAAAPQAVHAAAFSWNITGSGLFDAAANWTPAGGPPSLVTDTATFNQSGTYTVTFQTNKTNGSVAVDDGSVTFGGIL